MHPPSFGEMSEAKAASSEVTPNRVPAIDTAFYTVNINEERFLLNNVLKVLIFLKQAGTSALFMGLIACVHYVLLISLFQRDCKQPTLTTSFFQDTVTTFPPAHKEVSYKTWKH